MQERERDFLTLEELLKPRQIFIVNTGEQEVVEREIERFFGSILNVLGYSTEEIEAFVERKSFVLHSYNTQGVINSTEDRITLLTARNRVVASILETRDDFNYVQVSPAAYLNPEMIKGIKREKKE